MIRVIDIVLSIFGMLITAPLLILILIACYIDTGDPIFRQVRVGKDCVNFYLFKFRSMRRGTDSLPTHLVDSNSITFLGSLLRKSKLDELPQLINVFLGHMSFVGPRPCLVNQSDLITERKKRGVFSVLPGITGLAQIKKIDMSEPIYLAEIEGDFLKKISVQFYFKILLLTILGGGFGDRVNRVK